MKNALDGEAWSTAIEGFKGICVHLLVILWISCEAGA